MPVVSMNSEAGSVYWSSRLAFILAATGSAVGLGNIWGFPYKAGENGGGAFVLVYLVCILVVGLPIMMSEIIIGRQARSHPIKAMGRLAMESKHSRAWGYVGVMGVLAGFLILSFYSVIAGWSLAYVFRALGGAFSGIDYAGADTMLSGLVGDAERTIAWHTIFMVITVVIISRGVKGGLEKAIKIMMPALFFILLALVGISMVLGDATAAMQYLFIPDFSKLNGEVIVQAMGQAFFSLSLGMGAIMMYGAYLPDHASIPKTALAIVATDTVVAVIAGMAIFPLVFATPGLEPNEGFALVFKVLPQIFGQIQGGALIGALFFILLLIAAITSAVSLMEPVVSWMVERFNIGRAHATQLSGFVIWLLGLGTVFSFSIWSDKTLTVAPRIGDKIVVLIQDKSFFDILEFLTFNILLPLGGVLIAYFVGFILKPDLVQQQLKGMHRGLYQTWLFVVRNITPLAAVLILLNMVGLLDQMIIWFG